jgi:hypothetical protein
MSRTVSAAFYAGRAKLMSETILVFNPTNDPNGFARRHVGKQLTNGRTVEDIIRDAWRHRHDFVPNAITSSFWRAPARFVPDISYDPAIVDGASEEEVADALAKAGRR